MQEGTGAKRNIQAAWPSPQDYNEAVQNPRHCFADAELAACEVETNQLGLPRPNTGMFASVYRMQSPDSEWGLRCFLHNVSEQMERYALIQDYLNQVSLEQLVSFKMLPQGIRVRDDWFPVQKMQWCQGETLERWLSSNLFNRALLEQFLLDWKNLLRTFREAGIAHGDLQHGNIIMTGSVLKVVDYDGMFVPELKYKKSTELGHPNYQHPQRTADHFGLYLDNFSAWVIYTSVDILTRDPGLWMQLTGGEDCLLFRKSDFDAPLNSSTFMLLENHVNPDVREAARTLRYLTTLRLKLIPALDNRPEIPYTFSELGALKTSLPKWFDEDDSEKSAEVLEPEPVYDEPDPALDQGPASFSRKRRRSKIKGGSTTVRRFSESEEPEEDHAPAPVLSPLARLAREVKAAKASTALPTENSSRLVSTGVWREAEPALDSLEQKGSEEKSIGQARRVLFQALPPRILAVSILVLVSIVLYIIATLLMPALIGYDCSKSLQCISRAAGLVRCSV